VFFCASFVGWEITYLRYGSSVDLFLLTYLLTGCLFGSAQSLDLRIVQGSRRENSRGVCVARLLDWIGLGCIGLVDGGVCE